MTTQALEQEKTITEKTIIAPMDEVFKEIAPIPFIGTKHTLVESATLKQSLDNLFPEQEYEEKDLQDTRKILAEIADGLSQSELKAVITKSKYLIESWLDDFEREIFDGVTLQELLHEKGGL